MYEKNYRIVFQRYSFIFGPMKPLTVGIASVTFSLCVILLFMSGFSFQLIMLLLLIPFLFLVQSYSKTQTFLFDGVMKNVSFDSDYKVLSLLGE
jgi:hypothetical protein